ncbi:MAG: diaminopimelate decarboxylase [Caulobacterales bacterium]|nr:diaminopimelate decarboxylase [Caulobacterales bacterium]
MNPGLRTEGVCLATLAQAVGTPAYVYSAGALRAGYGAYRVAFAGMDCLVAYAVKANASLSVLKVLAAERAGADTVSEGEIRRALAAGIAPERIIFSGMGKTDAELAFALTLPGMQINVESRPEYERLSARAASQGVQPLVVLRVNPDVAAGGHDKISTGKSNAKFGISVDEALQLYRRAQDDGRVSAVGLGCHIGSQIRETGPFRDAWTVLREMTLTLRGEGRAIERIDLGGGLGVDYGDAAAGATPMDMAAVAAEVFADLGVRLAVEPGRSIVANAGLLLSRVIHVNRRAVGPTFLVLDAGMNDLLRPTLYDAWHEIVPVAPRAGTPVAYDVVGPVCESGDTFARGRTLPPMQAGDLVAFRGAGAYAASMASEYNSRLPAPEVLVDGERWALVRSRPDYADVLARERVPDWL